MQQDPSAAQGARHDELDTPGSVFSAAPVGATLAQVIGMEDAAEEAVLTTPVRIATKFVKPARCKLWSLQTSAGR